MDEYIARLERIYPNSKYVKINKYNEEYWKNKEYDSKFDEKASMNSWKKSPLSYEEAQEAAEEGYRIGWVVPKGYVIVDIDNEDDIRSQTKLERILTAFEVKYSFNYTSRGIHLLFQDVAAKIKSTSKIKCGLNIEIDTRANDTGYIILPTNDPHRQWGRWNDFVEEIPYFLMPIGKISVPSFIGMKDGDGRNTALFKWRTTLESKSNLTTKQIENTIRTINEYLFDIPIPNNELFKTVLRDREKEKSKSEKENPYNQLAIQVLSMHDLVYCNGFFYKYNGTYYEQIDVVDVEKIIHTDISKNLSKAARREIIEFIKLKCTVSPSDFNRDWYKIAAKNGIINLVTGELEESSKADLNTIFIPYSYNQDPPMSPIIDDFFKQITNGDTVKMQFLYEIVGYCLLKSNMFSKFFIFQGQGGTGKSTYINLITKLVGDNNVSNIVLSDLNKDYYISQLENKLVNIDDDVQDTKILEDSGKFKTMVSGNKITARRIYQDVVPFYPFCTFIFACNKLPRMSDHTSGIYRRMIIMKIDNKIEKPDPLFLQRVTDTDMEYLLYNAVQAIIKVIDRGSFTIDNTDELLLKEYRRNQSTVSQWCYEHETRKGDIVNKRCTMLYNVFKTWAENSGYSKIPSSITFRDEICLAYNVECRLYAKEKEAPAMYFMRLEGAKEDDNDYRPF